MANYYLASISLLFFGTSVWGLGTEFQESDIIFQESVGFEEVEENDEVKTPAARGESRNEEKKTPATAGKTEAVSRPVTIPEENLSRTAAWLRGRDEEFGELDDGEMVPPHVIIARRIAGKTMAFSVCTGYGRTLKGRDLCNVRNSILRMTGFLES